MKTPERALSRIHAARQRLQNPYAYIEDLEEKEPFRTLLHASQNPYATLAMSDSTDEDCRPAIALKTMADPELSKPQKQMLSKENFRSLCTQMFLPYVPPHQPRRIAKQHRDFVARNENRSGYARFKLVEALRRYDLSTTPGIRPHFNRELQGEQMKRKLQEIEASIVDE